MRYQQFAFVAFLCFMVSTFFAQAQSNWSLQAAVGLATETNLGDAGLRLSMKIERKFGKRLNAFAQIGTFQMFSSNENWEGDEAYQEKRSLSTANLDLGMGFALIGLLRWERSSHEMSHF